jgi:lysozyme
MRHITEDGLNFIKQFEQFRAKSYLCPAGLPTIGYGHVVGLENLSEVSEQEAEELLKRDVRHAEIAVQTYIKVPLNSNRLNALVSFTFNLGSGTLQHSTLRQKLNRGEYDQVPRELMRFVWCNGRKLRGLIKRRQAESWMFME